MTSHVGYPKEILDIDLMNEYYDGLQLNSENYLENYLTMKLFIRDFSAKEYRKKIDKKGLTSMETIHLILMERQYI